MEIVEYIREAKKKQNDIIKKEEKIKKREQKELEKVGKTKEPEINIVVIKESEEQKIAKQLITYFKGLLPKEVKVEQQAKE